jgi:hypothetical protein
MLTWGEFSAAEPDVADAGRDLLYQFGVGLAFLATVRPDGGPRLHPMCPLLPAPGTGMYAFIVPSPKQRDLLREGRYALHSFPCPDNEDAFYLAGKARHVEEAAVRAQLSDQFVRERAAFAVPPPGPQDELFELLLETCLLTRTSGHGDPAPRHTVWHAPEA